MWHAFDRASCFGFGCFGFGPSSPQSAGNEMRCWRKASHVAIDKSTRAPPPAAPRRSHATGLFVRPIARVLLEEFLRHDAVDQLHAINGLGHAEVDTPAGDGMG